MDMVIKRASWTTPTVLGKREYLAISIKLQWHRFESGQLYVATMPIRLCGTPRVETAS